jgi:chromosome segregation ATPase
MEHLIFLAPAVALPEIFDMNAALDTLQIVKRLKEAGFNDAQAEAVTNVVRDFRDIDFAQLASKSDIERLESDIGRLHSDIGRLESEIGRLAASTKTDIERLAAATKADIGRLESEIGRLAASTKTDIERLAAATKADIGRLAATTKADLATAIAEVKADIIKWVVGIGFAQVAMILTVLRVFPGVHS